MANAGVRPDRRNAPYYTANNPAALVTAFNTIINGVISCDLTINQQVDPATAPNATVTLNGMTLTYGTDWTLDPNGMTIHILGTACTTLKNDAEPDGRRDVPLRQRDLLRDALRRCSSGRAIRSAR